MHATRCMHRMECGRQTLLDGLRGVQSGFCAERGVRQLLCTVYNVPARFPLHTLRLRVRECYGNAAACLRCGMSTGIDCPGAGRLKCQVC